ncbi:MAG TPA: endonuclease/exonuclease/phosphatase family protein [Methylomirabilota bacterium]|jgi:endonuclease/exonuclease/phosphatase family metal-dependent hydrolase|nr:endonuclease/exonuclease/phosphatase family protein [Methylomirabilota bacterium]
MPRTIRIATFNLENFDEKPGQKPSLDERIALMRPQLLRLNADILCLQEVNGQEQPGQPRRLLALQKLLTSTPYDAYHLTSTMTTDGDQVYDERNLIILSRMEIIERRQHKPDDAPLYRMITAVPPQPQAKEILWERPILQAMIKLDASRTLHVFNVHLKSRLPTDIPGQKMNESTWKSCAAWAEGSFVSSMKRMGQALQLRKLIDALFDRDENALTVVCGDFNADYADVPLEAIRGDIENTNNPRLATRVLAPCERTVPESSRFSLIHQGRGVMLDHILVSRSLLAHYRTTEIHNELLHDESAAFATDDKFPESDHAPVVAEFVFPE